MFLLFFLELKVFLKIHYDTSINIFIGAISTQEFYAVVISKDYLLFQQNIEENK